MWMEEENRQLPWIVFIFLSSVPTFPFNKYLYYVTPQPIYGKQAVKQAAGEVSFWKTPQIVSPLELSCKI